MDGSVTHPPVQFPQACQNTPLVIFLTMLVSVMNNQLKKEYDQRVEDSQQQAADLVDKFDIVVVGGGSAGCVIAERMSRNPHLRVLLLERGGKPPQATNTPGLLSFVIGANVVEYVQSDCGVQCVFPQPYVLGGGSTLNGMMYVRGSSEDYNSWAYFTGNPIWKYNNVLRYFKRSERNLNATVAFNGFHSILGPQRVSFGPYRHPTIDVFRKAFLALNIPNVKDINAQGQLGHSVIQTTTGHGERWSTYRSFLEAADNSRRNLKVITYAKVIKILYDPSKDQTDPRPVAKGVLYRDAAGTERTALADLEVVVTAGALHTPQVLMLSGIGPKAQLEEAKIPVLVDSPGVGQNLQDHARPSGLEFKCEPPLCKVDWASRLDDLEVYNKARTGPLSEGSLMALTAFFRTSVNPPPPTGQGPPAKQPDMQIVFLGATEDPAGVRCSDDSWRNNIIKWTVAVLNPFSRGNVTLNPADPFGPPKVNLNYFSDPRDIDVAKAGIRLGLAMQGPLKNMGITLYKNSTAAPDCVDYPTDSEDYLDCLIKTTTYTSFHVSGTCRMGPEGDRMAVLDARMRVNGVRKTRVCDASIMPTVTSGNTNAPTIMIAEHCAELILQEHRLPAYNPFFPILP